MNKYTKDKLDEAVRRINASEGHDDRFEVASSIAKAENEPSEVRSFAMGVMMWHGIRSVEPLVEILVGTPDDHTRKSAYSFLLTVKRDLSAGSKKRMAQILLRSIDKANYDGAVLSIDLLKSYEAHEALLYLKLLQDNQSLRDPILKIVEKAIIEIEQKGQEHKGYKK